MLQNLLRSSATAALFLSLTTAPLLAQDVELPEPPQTLQMHRVADTFVALPVTIGEGEPMNWILDTGASHSAIAQTIAEELGFVSARQSLAPELDPVQTLTRMYDAERFWTRDMSIAGRPLQDINMVVVPVPPEGPSIAAGLLGYDAFAEHDLRINFDTGELDLGEQTVEHTDARIDPDRQPIFAAARVGAPRRYARVLIDSGSPVTLVNNELKQALSSGGVQLRTVTGVDGLRNEQAAPVVLRNLRIGGVCLGRQSALHADLDIFDALGWDDEPAILIGMDLLPYIEMTLDKDSGAVEISAVRDPDVCDQRIQWDRRFGDQRS